MRIDGTSHQHRAAVNQKKDAAKQETPGQVARDGDSVELSGGPTDLASLAQIARQDDSSRTSKIEEVRQRLSSGYYNTDQFRSDLANAVLSNGVLDKVLVDAVQVQDVRRQVEEMPESREDRVEEARERVTDGFYDQKQTKLDTADRIIDELI